MGPLLFGDNTFIPGLESRVRLGVDRTSEYVLEMGRLQVMMTLLAAQRTRGHSAPRVQILMLMC